MLEYAQAIIIEADAIAAKGVLLPVLEKLRTLPIEDFGELLMTMPNMEFPHLSQMLPTMASDETQRSWTGDHGYGLLRQTLAFARIMNHGFLRWTGQRLEGKSILDFGCGYGRFARIMYYFTDPDNYYGLDPWDLSIELCRKANLPGHLAVSEYLPTSLPIGDIKVDLIFAFSVFTHLSLRATGLALRTLRNYISDAGLLVITIRPIDYWSLGHVLELIPDAAGLVAAHKEHGFAFEPLIRPAVDGDITYGHTSMSLEFVHDHFNQWQVVQFDRSLDDPYQLVVFLKPNALPNAAIDPLAYHEASALGRSQGLAHYWFWTKRSLPRRWPQGSSKTGTAPIRSSISFWNAKWPPAFRKSKI